MAFLVLLGSLFLPLVFSNYHEDYCETYTKWDVQSHLGLALCPSLQTSLWNLCPVLTAPACMLSHSIVSDSFVTPWAIACQAPLSLGLPRQKYWSGWLFLLQGFFPTQGWSLHLLRCQADLLLSHPRSPARPGSNITCRSFPNLTRHNSSCFSLIKPSVLGFFSTKHLTW